MAESTVRIKFKRRTVEVPKEKKACLIVMSGPDLGKVFFLNKPTMIIGREEGSDIWINEPYVSRRHAHITSREDKVIIIDLKSTNGTFVNYQRVEYKFIKDEDEISVGNVTMKAKYILCGAEYKDEFEFSEN